MWYNRRGRGRGQVDEVGTETDGQGPLPSMGEAAKKPSARVPGMAEHQRSPSAAVIIAEEHLAVEESQHASAAKHWGAVST